MEIKKTHRSPHENNEIHGNLKILIEHLENHKNLRISLENNANHEKHRIWIENIKKLSMEII